MYFCNFPCRIKVSTWSFICLHSLVWCLWSRWNLQYLLVSLLSTRELFGFGHRREGSSLICIRTYSIGIIRGVKFMNLGFLSGSPSFYLWSTQHFVSPSFYRNCCLFLRLSSFFLSFLLRIFCIHVILSFMEQLLNYFWWTFSDWEEKLSWQQPCLEGC